MRWDSLVIDRNFTRLELATWVNFMVRIVAQKLKKQATLEGVVARLPVVIPPG